MAPPATLSPRQAAVEAERAEQQEQEAARELELQRSRKQLSREHRHRSKRREQLLRQQQIADTWSAINTARIKSVEVEQTHRVVQEKRSVRRLHHQVLSILLQAWQSYVAVRRRVQRSKLSQLVPSSMLAIEKEIARRRMQQLNEQYIPGTRQSPIRALESPESDAGSASDEEPGEKDVEASPAHKRKKLGAASKADAMMRSGESIESIIDGAQGPEKGLLGSAVQVMRRTAGMQTLIRGFFAWQQWCRSVADDPLTQKANRKLAGMFRFYLASARGVELTMSVGAGQQPTSQPAGPRRKLKARPEELSLVLHDDADDDEEEGGDTLPELNSARRVDRLAPGLSRGEQSAPPRLAPQSSTLSAYKLPELELPSMPRLDSATVSDPSTPVRLSAASVRFAVHAHPPGGHAARGRGGRGRATQFCMRRGACTGLLGVASARQSEEGRRGDWARQHGRRHARRRSSRGGPSVDAALRRHTPHGRGLAALRAARERGWGGNA